MRINKDKLYDGINKTGKGYEYPVIGHMAGLERTIHGERKKLLVVAGF
ncbi:hypothetical protein AALA00_03870 [Lachnospiraceae bacterium 46-15]